MARNRLVDKKSTRDVQFITLPESPCVAEFYEIWLERSANRRGQRVKICSQSVQGLRSSDTLKIARSH